MQVTETAAEGLKREYAITIAAAEIAAKVDEKLVAARADFAMRGFRKGKAPMSLMKKMFGKSVTGETIQELVDETMRAHLAQNDHRPAMQPDVKIANENFQDGEDLALTIAYELLPDVPAVAYGEIAVEKMVVAVDDSAVDEAIENLAQNASDYEDAAEGPAAEDKDQVVIDFLGKIDGEAFEGGAAEDFPLTLGSGQFIPGFEAQLVGAKVGEERAVEVSFPENYGAKNLAGKAAVFDVTVKAVKAPKPAEINEDLAKKYGAESLDALKGDIRTRIEGEYAQASRAHLKRKVLDALDTAVDFDLPPTMVNVEARQIAHQLWHEENPEVHGHDHPAVDPTDEHVATARRRVKLGLLLAQIGSANEIRVTDEELQTALIRQARQYPGQERQFYEWARNDQNALNQIQAPIYEDKVVDFILEQANVTEKPVSKDDLEKALEALETETV